MTALLKKMSPWKGVLGVVVLLLASYRSFSNENGGPCSATGHETLQTAANRYQPGQSVSVTGSGYQASCNLTVSVSGPASASTLATTDPGGNLSFSYALGSAPGEYTVATYLGDDADPWTSKTFTNGPYIETDMPDYAPYNPVTISGSGWQPGESISILIDELDGPDADVSYTAVADSSGNFTSRDFTTDEHDVYVHFLATATGQSSGYSTQTKFSDAFTATSRSVTGTLDWNADSTWSITRTGSITTSTASTTVTGTSTKFLTELSVGNVITQTNDANVLGTVASIASDTSLTLTANAATSQTSIAWKARRVPATTDDALIGNNSNVTVTAPASINSLDQSGTLGTSLTINSGQSLTVAGAMTVTGNGSTNQTNVNGSLSAASLTVSGGGNGTSIGNVVVNTGGSVTVSGALTVAASSGPAHFDMSSGSGTASASSVTISASSPTGGRIGDVLVGTGTLTVSGNVAFGTCAAVANCSFTFSGAGTANIGGNLGGGQTLNTTAGAGSTINFNGTGANTMGAFGSHSVSPVWVSASFATPPMSPQAISGAFTWSLPTM